jgi:hypothetical protein
VLLTSAIRWQSTRIASWLSNANVSRQFPLTRTAPSKSHFERVPDVPGTFRLTNLAIGLGSLENPGAQNLMLAVFVNPLQGHSSMTLRRS